MIDNKLKKLATMDETKKHIITLGKVIDDFIFQLEDRIENHDTSKLQQLEVDTFTEFTDKLKGSTYGSDEYNQFLNDMKPALDHHYENNRHHPEHFENGINGMNLVDIVEMLSDWKAASMRHDDGDIRKSLEINRERFNIDDQLYDILKNTIEDLYF